METSIARADKRRRRVSPAWASASAIGCLTFTEGERILGARKKHRKNRPVQLAPVDIVLRLGQGQGTGGDGAPAEDLGAVMAGAEGFEAAISGMAARLELPAAVGKRAGEVFRKMEEAKAWPHHRPFERKGRSKGALYAACLSIACRHEGSARSLNELALAATAAGKGEIVKTKEIVKLSALIRARLGEEDAGQAAGVGVVRASGYMRYFCQQVGMGNREAAVAMEAARRLEEIDLQLPHIGESVAAAVVCMALERAGAFRTEVYVSEATGVSRATINIVFKKLLPYADRLFG